MAEFTERYINPFTDYGFKRIFGEEPNKDLLLDFLNVLLEEEQGRITDLTYLKNEQLGTAEIARFTPDQIRSYEDSLKYYRDLKNSLDTAREEGMIEGIERVAQNMLAKGMPIRVISEITGLSEQQVEELKKKNT